MLGTHKKPGEDCSSPGCRTLRSEVESRSKLDGAWSVALPWQRTETVGTGAGVKVVTRTRIEENRMVQNVHEYEVRFKIEALRNFEVFLDAEVHVPIREAAQNTKAAVTGIQTQNRLAELIICGCLPCGIATK